MVKVEWDKKSIRGYMMKLGTNLLDIDESIIRRFFCIIFLAFILIPNSLGVISSSSSNHSNEANIVTSIKNEIVFGEKLNVAIKDGTHNWDNILDNLNMQTVWKDSSDIKVNIVNQSVEMIIGFDTDQKSTLLLSNILSTTNSVITVSLNQINAILVTTPIDNLSSFVEQTTALSTVKYVEPNGLVHVNGFPTDPDWEKQWGFEAIDTNEAWDIETGDFSNVLVAVIDTGVNYTHPDISAQYVPLGYDWIDNDTTPYDLFKNDYSSGHGTFIAGIIAATANNSKGIAGIANVQIMAERIFNATGWGLFYDGVRAIIHATDADADILSMSYGFTWPSQAHEDACKYAYDKGVILVASSGNDGIEINKYPASFENVISVGSAYRYISGVEEVYGKSYYSTYGETLDLVAPGDFIYSLDAAGGYRNGSGTSYACPHVTGVAALMKSKYSDWTNDLIIDRILDSAIDIGDSNWENRYGYGLVNAYNALKDFPRADLSANIEVPMTTSQGSNHIVNATITNWGTDQATNIYYEILQNDKIIQNGTLDSLETLGSITLQVSWLVSENSTQEFTLKIRQVSFEHRTENNIITRQTKILDKVNSIGLLHNAMRFPYPYITYIKNHYHSKGFYVEDILQEITSEKISSFTHLFIGYQYPDDNWLDSEISAIQEFIENGGVCVFFSGEPTDAAVEIAGKYGITFTNSSFSSSHSTEEINHNNPLMLGVERVTFSTLNNSLSISGEAQSMFYDSYGEKMLGVSVKVQKGLLCVITTNSLDQNLKYGDNKKILDNLLEWNYPKIELEQLQKNLVIDGKLHLNWTAYDRNDDALTFSIFYWNGEAWISIVNNITDTNYDWNSWKVKNGDFYKIKVEAFDGRHTSFDTTIEAFTVRNTKKLVAILVPSIAIPVIALAVIIPVLIKRKK